MINRKIVKESCIYICLTLILFSGCIYIKNSFSALDSNQKSKHQIEQESLAYEMEVVKETKLTSSFGEMMALAKKHEGEHLRYSIKRYFDAKSIYPDRIEPRLALTKSYIELSKEIPGYCRMAEKEIHYAWQYIPETKYTLYADLLTQLETKVSELCL